MLVRSLLLNMFYIWQIINKSTTKMKRIALLIATIAVISCQEKIPADYALVSGTILNKKGAEIIIMNQSESSKKVITVAEDGKFKDTLRFETGAYYLIDGKQNAQIYLDNGSDILVEFDAADFKNTITFSGEGAGTSNYLLYKAKKTIELVGDQKEFYALEEASYKAKLVEIKTNSEDLINTTEGVSEEYKAKEVRNINYEYLSKLDIFERYHAHYAQKPEFKVSEGFLKELEGLTFDNEEDFIFSNNYENLVSSHYRKQVGDIVKAELVSEDIAYMKAINTNSSEVIKNTLLYNAAKYEITYTNDVASYYKEFIAGSTNEENNAKITESYNKLKTVAKGNISPIFEGYENYKGGTTSLADLKGKYVYVDVWATWCGPCKREIPFLKEVEKKYHGKNIEFVSISVDAEKDHDKWKKMVEEKELEGVQLFADKSWNSDFVQGYLIKGIPCFILIDPAGNIVSANAPNPSDEKLIELFNELKI